MAMGRKVDQSVKPLSHMPREVAALMAALQHNFEDTSQLQQLGDEEWDKLLTFTDRAHLTLSLAQFDWKGFPLWVMERLETNLADNSLRFERVKATYQEAAAALNSAGVEHIVLKGFTQSSEFVRNPRLRAQSDVDLYVPPEMIGRAQKALESIGYRMDQILDYSRADHLPTLIRPNNSRWRGNYFDPAMPLSIELHFVLWNKRVAQFSVPEIDSYWERRIRRRIEDMSFWSLNPVDHLGYFALHILRNIFAGEWVVNLTYELSAFLHHHAQDDAFWEEWSRTHSPQLRTLEMIAIYEAKAWFDCDLHPTVEQEFARLPVPIAKWLERFAGSPLDVMFQQNKDFVWLHAAFLDSFERKRKFLFRTLIPTKVPGRNDPVVRMKNRQMPAFRAIQPRFPYLSYLLGRLGTHARMVTETMAAGVAWQWSQRRLRDNSGNSASQPYWLREL
jgi:Uncharacterised nucleotidyltransferase